MGDTIPWNILNLFHVQIKKCVNHTKRIEFYYCYCCFFSCISHSATLYRQSVGTNVANELRRPQLTLFKHNLFWYIKFSKQFFCFLVFPAILVLPDQKRRRQQSLTTNIYHLISLFPSNCLRINRRNKQF